MIVDIVFWGGLIIFCAGWFWHEYAKYGIIYFHAGDWLVLKDTEVKTYYPLYIRLSEDLRKSDSWFKSYHYFEPDGAIKSDTIGVASMRKKYEIVPDSMAGELEEAFQKRTKAQTESELKQQQEMRQQALTQFLKGK